MRSGRAGWWVAVAAVAIAVALPFVAALAWDDYSHRSAGLIAAPVLAVIGLATLAGDDGRGLLQLLLELGLYAWVLGVAWLAAQPEDDDVRTRRRGPRRRRGRTRRRSA